MKTTKLIIGIISMVLFLRDSLSILRSRYFQCD